MDLMIEILKVVESVKFSERVPGKPGGASGAEHLTKKSLPR